MNCEQQWKRDVVHFDSLVLHTLFLWLQNVTQVLFYNNISKTVQAGLILIF